MGRRTSRAQFSSTQSPREAGGDPVDVSARQVLVRREVEAALGPFVSHGISRIFLVRRQHVHRIEHRPRLDARLIEGTHDCIPPFFSAFAQEYGVHPVDMLHARLLDRQDEPISQARERLVVQAGECPAILQCGIDGFHLGQADRRLDVGHAVVVADHRKPVAPLRVHALTAIEPQLGGQRVVVGRHHAAFTSRHNLVAEEAEAGAVAQRTDPLAVDLGSPRLGRILQNPEAVLASHGRQPGHLCGMSIQVDWDDPARAGRDLLLDAIRIDIHRLSTDIHQNGGGTAIAHGVGSGDVGDGRDNDFVAGLQVQRHERQMERGGAVIGRDRMPGSAKIREGFLEGTNVFAVRGDPVGIQAIEHVLALVALQLGLGNADAIHLSPYFVNALSRHACHPRVRRKIRNDHRPSSGEHVRTDRNAGNDLAADAEEGSWPYLHVAGQARLRSNMHRLADVAIVIDACTGVHNSQIGDRRVRVDDGSRHDSDALPEACRRRNDGCRANGIHQPKSERSGHARKALAKAVRTDSNKCTVVSLLPQPGQVMVTLVDRNAETLFAAVLATDAARHRRAHGAQQLDAYFGVSAGADDDDATIDHAAPPARAHTGALGRAKNRLTESTFSRSAVDQSISAPESGWMALKSSPNEAKRASHSVVECPVRCRCEMPNSAMMAACGFSVMVRCAPSRTSSSAPSTSIFNRSTEVPAARTSSRRSVCTFTGGGVGALACSRMWSEWWPLVAPRWRNRLPAWFDTAAWYVCTRSEKPLIQIVLQSNSCVAG